MLKLDKEFHRYLWHPLYDNDLSLWEPKDIVADAKRLHANAIHWSTTGSSSRSNYVFYQSKVHKVFPLLGDRDLLKEMVDECHRNNIYLIAYINVHWAPKEFFDEHPDWLQVSPNGKILGQGYGHGGPMCANRKSYRETWVRPIVEEVTSGYDVDGIFLDGPGRRLNTCYCEDCRELFKEKYGAEMPAEQDWTNPDFRNFIKFNYDSEISFVKFVRDLAHRNKPGLPVYKNGAVMTLTWFNGVSPQNDAEVADLIGAESFMYYIRPLDVPYWKTSSVSKYLHSAARGKPSITYLCYGHKPWHSSPMSGDQHRQNIGATVANGCYPFMTIEDFTRRDQREYPAVSEMFGFVERHQDIYVGAESKANVGLVYSQRTSDYYERGTVIAGSGTHDYYCKSERTYEEEVKGFYEALMHSGVPFDVVCDKAMNEKDLERFDVIVLPNTACLTPETVEILKKHVAAGKGLVTSFEVSSFGAEGDELEKPRLAEELGIGEIRERMGEAWRDYMRVVTEHPVIGDTPLETDLAMPKHNLVVTPSPDADVLAYAMELLPFGYAPIGKMTDAPTIIAKENKGGGRCVYFASLIGAHYLEEGIGDLERLMGRAVKWAARRIPVQVSGSPNVEVTLYEKGDRKFIHLINYTSRPQLPVEHVEPVRDLVIDCDSIVADGVTSARSLWTDTDLPIERTKEGLRIKLDCLKVYDAIVLDK